MSNTAARGSRAGDSGPTRQQLDELDALLQRMLDLPVSQGDEADEPAPVAASPRPEATPPVRFYEPEYDDDDDSPPPGYPPTSTIIGAAASTAPVPSLAPRVMPAPPLEPPVPGGRHDLVEDRTAADPTEELARIRAQMQQRADLPPTANIENAPRVEGEWVPLRSSWQPSAQTWKPLAERWEAQSQSQPQPFAGPPTFPQRRPPSGPVVQTTETEPDVSPPAPPATASGGRKPPETASPPTQGADAPRSPGSPPPSWPAAPLVWFNAAFDVVLLPWCPRGKFLRGRGGRTFLGTVGVLCLLAAAALVAADRFGWTW